MKNFNLLLIFTLSCLWAAGISAQNKPWTMMVYLNGSDLETNADAGTNDIVEMLGVPNTSNVNVVVLTGGSTKDGWQTIKCYVIENGGETEVTYNANVDEDMGNPQNLTNFINWAITNYPADKYMLDMWNHGGDIQGYGWDQITGNHLTVPMIKSAISSTNHIQANNKFDLIGFDACLMATLEVSSTLSAYGEYMVASEEQEPGHGWDYTPIVQALQDGSNADGYDIAVAVIDGFIAQGESMGTHGLTLSLIDLTTINDVVNKLELLFTTIQNDDKVRSLQQARGGAQEYSKSVKTPAESEDMVDVGDLMRKLKSVDASLAAEADSVLAALAYTVPYERHDNTRPKSTGLTMFLPHNKLVSFDAVTGALTENYNPIDFSTSIKSFVTSTYVPQAQSDNEPPSGTTQNAFGGQSPSLSANASMDTLSVIQVNHANDLEEVLVVLLEEFPGNPDELIFLGSTFPDSSVFIAEDLEEFSYGWDGMWLGINGFPAYITDLHDYEIEVSPGVFEIETQVHIPAILNPNDEFEGTDIIIEYRYDEDFNITLSGINREPYFLGDELIVPKEKINLVPGDRIMLLYESFNQVTDEEFFVIDEDAVFTIETNAAEDLELVYTDLFDGNYKLGFVLIDHSQNDTLIIDDRVFTVGPNAVVESFAAAGIKLFPNPANAAIVINYENFGGNAFDVRISDINGRIISTSTSNQQQVTIATNLLPNGLYVVELTSGDKTYTDKVMISH